MFFSIRSLGAGTLVAEVLLAEVLFLGLDLTIALIFFWKSIVFKRGRQIFAVHNLKNILSEKPLA